MDSTIKKKDNIFIEILLIPYYILKYFLIGLKILFIDSIISLFDHNNKSSVKEYSDSQISSLNRKKALLDFKLEQVEKKSDRKRTYRYIAKNSNGVILKGTVYGHSIHDINSFLINEGLEVYDIKTSLLIEFLYKETNLGSNRLSNKNLIFWLTQLTTYLKAGLPLPDANKLVCSQIQVNKTQLQALKSVNYELSLGENFSEALEKQKGIFPNLLINMIKAAEASGTLEETLEDMANYYEEVNKSKKQTINAIIYPSIILVFSIFVIIFIMVYIVPQFKKIYANSDAQITGITAMLINTSDYLKSHILSILGIIICIVLLIILLYKRSKSFRKDMQVLLMHLPIIRNVIIYNELSIFSKTFASLLKNNVYITDTIDLLGKITNNEIYKEIFNSTINNIVNGEKISDAFKNHWAVPEIAYYMIVTGESTGQLEQMMDKVSDYYQSQSKSLITNLKTFLEPILISVLAIIVGIIIISVIVPMFDIYGTIQ